MKFQTFSANSLKLLDKSPDDFKLKYKEGLFLNQSNKSAKAGEKLHNFLCYYLKGFDMTKIEASLSEADRIFLNNIKTFDEVEKLKNAKNKDIEQPFLIKCAHKQNTAPCTQNPMSTQDAANDTFFLTGRFDAVLRNDFQNTKNPKIKIYDWKTQNLPKNPENDIQTMVYLYSSSKLYKTQDISITYVSLTKNEAVEIPYNKERDYFSAILNIVKKA